MKDNNSQQPQMSGRKNKRIPIVTRLNWQFTGRLISIFFMLNVLIVAISGLALIVYGEWVLADVLDEFSPSQITSQETRRVLSATGVKVTPLVEDITGIKVPEPLQFVFPEQTATARRKIIIPADDEHFIQQINAITYQAEMELAGNPYGIAIRLTPIIWIMLSFLCILMLSETSAILRCLFTGGYGIRRTLNPIVELAEKAQSLGTKRGPYTPEEMKALAGKLKGINAARLDTRIEIAGAQDELKDVATAINGMLDRINESYRAQARFVSDASHELRTPIAAIQGYANLLDRWGKHDEQALQESINAIKSEADNMKDLIEQLLFLARGDNHAMELQIEEVKLDALAETVLRETQMFDESHEYQKDLAPVIVLADSGLLKQALRILVDNAIKYTPLGGTITLSIASRNGRAWITVQDEGIGIPPEAVSRIFDRFYRADESRARATGGTGLGLSIAKWIIERHGGYIEVLSRQDVGTRISLVIPASEAPSKDQAAEIKETGN